MRFKKLPVVKNDTFSIKLYAKFRKKYISEKCILALERRDIDPHVPVYNMIFFIFFFYKGQINLLQLQGQNGKFGLFLFRNEFLVVRVDIKVKFLFICNKNK